MGWQISLTGFVIFACVVAFDEGPEWFQHWLKIIGGIAFWLIPIGLIVWIWQ